MILMLVLFVLALVLVVSGWKMTGQLAGLGIMLVIDPLRFKERQKESFPWTN